MAEKTLARSSARILPRTPRASRAVVTIDVRLESGSASASAVVEAIIIATGGSHGRKAVNTTKYPPNVAKQVKFARRESRINRATLC